MTEIHHTEDRLLSRIHFVVEALHVVLTVLTFHSLTIPYVLLASEQAF
jgi:hypothetical protein